MGSCASKAKDDEIPIRDQFVLSDCTIRNKIDNAELKRLLDCIDTNAIVLRADGRYYDWAKLRTRNPTVCELYQNLKMQQRDLDRLGL